MTSTNFRDFFGDPAQCQEDLVAVGGNLEKETLFYAYTHGIFPWSENPVRWYCLEPRAVFDIHRLHLSQRVKQKIRSRKYSITFNQAFTTVMKGCSIRKDDENTWISDGFITAYEKMHEAGYAHSVEAWDENGMLVGGVYGVAIGKFFAGESMFSFRPDAGKISLWHLFEVLKAEQFELFDTQQLNIVTWQLGGFEIEKREYLRRLEKSLHGREKLNIQKYNHYDFGWKNVF